MQKIICLGTIIFLISCGHKGGISWRYLLKKYANDSLKLEAVHFLKENMGDLKSEKITFYKNGIKKISLNLRDFQSFDSLVNFMKINKIIAKTQYVDDEKIVTTQLIENTIDKAFVDWKNYPWNKNVGWEHFLKYLLPYKIADEFPEDWRGYFSVRYNFRIKELIHKYDTGIVYKNFYKDPNDIYYNGYTKIYEEWYKYNDRPNKLANAPSLSEMLLTKNGDCYGNAYIGVYMLRSFGIPATIDYTPVWGSKNGSHAIEVFVDTTGKIRTASGRSFYRPAKVFRLTFEKQKIWGDSIKPFIDENFVLSNLRNNHWADVTNEHTKTVNIQIFSDQLVNSKYAYICVNNYDKWVPIYWGIVDKVNKTAIFKNMGVSMLYRIAVPNGTGFKIVSDIFMIDSVGNMCKKNPESNNLINMNIEKVNTGIESWVKKDSTYDFYIWFNGSWNYLGSGKCEKDSIVPFNSIPAKGLYLVKRKNNKNNIERPFTYENFKQYWW